MAKDDLFKEMIIKINPHVQDLDHLLYFVKQ